MKIHCTVCVVNRLLPNLPVNLRKKPVKSTLALCKHPKNEEYCLILFSGHNKSGTKYPLSRNIKQVLTRFLNEGKCTIQLKNPEHDLCIQADVIQLKGFLHLFKRAIEGKVSFKELTLSSMSVTPVKPKDVAPTKLVITKRSDYPTKGFPRTLELLYINDIQRCGLDRGILQLNKLKILNLSNNIIEFLPEELNRLPNLKELNVSHNLLGKSSLKQWQWISGHLSKSLILLDLSHNQLTFVPDQLVKLHNLMTLHLSYNNLKTLPVGIGSLRNLKIFSASNNSLTVLPGSVKKLRLQSIDISSNHFGQSIPNGAGILPQPLQVCTLKEYAGKKVLWARLPYPKGSIPLSLIDFLDYAKYCVCGKWKTIKAHVEYPTMKYKFDFEEDLEFWSLGQPLLNYKQVTRNPKNQMPMHLEYGFVRPDEDMCTIAFLTAQNLGLATLEEGYVKEGEMVVQTACIGVMKFSKQTVLDIRRTYKLNDKGELEYCCWMETPQTPLAKHIEAIYKKQDQEC